MLCFILLTSFYAYKTNNLLYNNKTSVIISNFNSSDYSTEQLNKYFIDMYQNENMAISKYIYRNTNELIIYTNDLSIYDRVNIYSGKSPEVNTDQFVSTYKTKDNNQVGIFFKTEPNLNITIKNIDTTNEFGLDGVYYISLYGSKTIQDFINYWDNSMGNIDIYRNENTNLYIDSAMLAPISVLLVFVILCVMQYSNSQLKKSAILKLNGFSTFEVSLIKILSLSKLLFLSGITILVLFILYIFFTFQNNNYYLNLILLYMSILVILIIALNILNTIFLIYKLQNENELSLLKGKKSYKLTVIFSYILKFFCVIFFLSSVNNFHSNFLLYQSNISNLSDWGKTEHIHRMKLNYSGERDLAIDLLISNRISLLYKDLVENKDMFIIDASNYNKISSGEYIYIANSVDIPADINPNGKTVTIDENYLKVNPIYDSNNLVIYNQIQYDPYVLNILVPEKLREFENQIKANFREHFYFQKVIVDNIYNTELDNALNYTDISDLSINIIYVKNDQQYFTFSALVEPDNYNTIYDPIAIIYTNNVHVSYIHSYFSFCTYFIDDGLNAYDSINDYISKYDLNASITGVASVYTQKSEIIYHLQKLFIRNIVNCTVVSFSYFTVIYILLSSYYERHQFKLYIKNLFGYNFFDRNSIFIFTMMLCNISALVFSIVTLNNKGLAILSFSIIIVIESVYFIILNSHLNSKSFNSIVKGRG